MGLLEMFLSGGEWNKPLTAWRYDDVTTGSVYAMVLPEKLPTGSIATLPKDLPYPLAVGYTGHVGFYHRGKVYQSAGHKSGTIITEPSDTTHNKAWEYWYQIPWLDYSAGSGGGGIMIYCQKGDGRETATSFSKHVWAMQDALVKLGFKMVSDKEYAPDGRYWNATSNAVQSFKTANKLAGNGDTFDTECVTVMLELLHDLETGIPQDQMDIANSQIAVLTGQLGTVKSELDAAKKSLLNLNNVTLPDLNNRLFLAEQARDRAIEAVAAKQGEINEAVKGWLALMAFVEKNKPV